MKSLKESKNLTVFYQFGFKYIADSGKQVRGKCPFCGSVKFHINPENKKWDCKACNKEGGYQRFLVAVYKASITTTTDAKLVNLSNKKGLQIKTLKKFGVTYFKTIEKYLVPVWDITKTNLSNLKLYDIQDNSLKSCGGSKATLYNLQATTQKYLVVWNVEGEWDTMAMDEILVKAEITDAISLGVPGANTFKPDWCIFFQDKIVYNGYDNDHETIKNDNLIVGAGKVGQRKIQTILTSSCKELHFLNWLKRYKHKADIRDLYLLKKKNATKTLKRLIAMMKPNPMPILAPEGYEEQAKEKETIPEKEKVEYTGVGLLPEEVYNRYGKWLKLQDKTCLDILFGAVIGNRLPGDPIWLFFIASSGGTKSELIMSLDDCHHIKPLSSLTAQTLISGTSKKDGSDPSLLPRLDGKVLCIKDFTVILEMPETIRNAIIAQLRDAYDQKCAKGFGTGERTYDSKFGLVAGVTPIIEQYLHGGSAMGERMLSYYLSEDNSYTANKLIMGKALENIMSGEKDAMREDLKAIANEVLNYDFGKIPALPENLFEQLFCVSQWAAIVRGTVPRDKYSREVIGKALIEKPTRLVTQFAKILLGITQYRRKERVTQEEIDTIKRIALDTTPRSLSDTVKIMCKVNIHGSYSSEQIGNYLRLPARTIDTFLENLQILRVLNVKKSNSSMKMYALSKMAKSLINLGNLYERDNNQWDSKSKPKRKKKIHLTKN